MQSPEPLKEKDLSIPAFPMFNSIMPPQEQSPQDLYLSQTRDFSGKKYKKISLSHVQSPHSAKSHCKGGVHNDGSLMDLINLTYTTQKDSKEFPSRQCSPLLNKTQASKKPSKDTNILEEPKSPYKSSVDVSNCRQEETSRRVLLIFMS